MPEQTKLKRRPLTIPCPNPFHPEHVRSIMEGEHGGVFSFWVRCGRCGLSGPLKPTESEAIAAWNTRPESDLERLAREVVRTRRAVEETKIYSVDRVRANLEAANAFGDLAAHFAEQDKGKTENERT